MRGGVVVLSVFKGSRKQWCRMLAFKQAKQASKSSSNFSLVLFGKGREIHVTTLTNPCNKLDKSKKEARAGCMNSASSNARVTSIRSQQEKKMSRQQWLTRQGNGRTLVRWKSITTRKQMKFSAWKLRFNSSMQIASYTPGLSWLWQCFQSKMQAIDKRKK